MKSPARIIWNANEVLFALKALRIKEFKNLLENVIKKSTTLVFGKKVINKSDKRLWNKFLQIIKNLLTKC